MAEEQETDFFGTEEILLGLPNGDLRIHTSSDFASTVNAQQEERMSNSVETESENILAPSNDEVKTTENAISKTAINHFFKMFYATLRSISISLKVINYQHTIFKCYKFIFL